MWQIIKTIIFALRLSTTIFFELCLFSWFLYQDLVILFFFFVIFFGNMIFFFQAYQTQVQQVALEFFQEASWQKTEKIKKEITHQQSLLEKQPTHRDVLYNLAVLSSLLQDTDDSLSYKMRAQQQDPNNLQVKTFP